MWKGATGERIARPWEKRKGSYRELDVPRWPEGIAQRVNAAFGASEAKVTPCVCGCPTEAHAPAWPHECCLCACDCWTPARAKRLEWGSEAVPPPKTPLWADNEDGDAYDPTTGEVGPSRFAEPSQLEALEEPGPGWSSALPSPEPPEGAFDEVDGGELCAPGGGLGKNANYVSPPAPSSPGATTHEPLSPPHPGVAQAVIKRYALLERLRPISLERIAKCRRVRCSPHVDIHRTDDQTGVGLSGVVTCGSVWGCPVCAVRIYTQRAERVQAAISAHGAKQTSLLTVTLRHAEGHRLSVLRTALAEAFRKLWQGKKGTKLRRQIVGYVRAFETTHGANGWHPHLHAIIFWNREPSEEWVAELKARWVSIVQRLLGTEGMPTLNHGLDVRAVRDTEYLTKLGLEISSLEKPTRAEHSRNPWQIARAAAHGDARSVALWREYLDATWRTRQLTWSRGLELALGVTDVDDDEAAEEKETPGKTIIASVPGVVWDRLRPTERVLVARAARSTCPLWSLSQVLARARGT